MKFEEQTRRQQLRITRAEARELNCFESDDALAGHLRAYAFLIGQDHQLVLRPGADWWAIEHLGDNDPTNCGWYGSVVEKRHLRILLRILAYDVNENSCR